MEGARVAPRVLRRSLESLGLVVVVLLGAFVRSSGFTRFDLWFDDAWFALPARVGFSTANRMVVTTPLYSLGLREWIRLHQGSTAWDQVPSFVLGLAGIVAVFALLRFFRMSPVLVWLGALLVAVGPVTSTYSTRVKEYSADLLLSCLVLWLFERWRRQPRRATVAALAAASGVAISSSAICGLVVLGVGAAGCWCALADRRRAAHVLSFLGVVAAVTALDWVLWYRHVPPRLEQYWQSRGFMVQYSSSHEFTFSFQQMFSGLPRGLLGAGEPFLFHNDVLNAQDLSIAVVSFLALAVVVVAPIASSARRPRQLPGPLVASSFVVLAALAAAVVGIVPFGAGRTDEFVYPPVLLLVTGVLTSLAPRLGAIGPRRVALAGAALVAAGLVAFGLTHRSVYPTTNVRGLYAKLRPRLEPGDLVVPDGYVSYTWAMDDLSPWHVSFARVRRPWTQGFYVVSDATRVAMSTNFLGPDASFATLARRTHRLWYVGITWEAYDPLAPRRLWNVPVRTATRRALVNLGWTPTFDIVTTTHDYAQLFVHR